MMLQSFILVAGIALVQSYSLPFARKTLSRSFNQVKGFHLAMSEDDSFGINPSAQMARMKAEAASLRAEAAELEVSLAFCVINMISSSTYFLKLNFFNIMIGCRKRIKIIKITRSI